MVWHYIHASIQHPSILPYEDCCTVFTPRHPKTRPSMEEILEAEANLDMEALIQRAMDGIERVTVEWE